MHLFVQQITVKCTIRVPSGSKKYPGIVYYQGTQRVPGYPQQPYTRSFNNFFVRIFTIFFNFGKFVKIRDFFAEVTNSRSMVWGAP